jgi:hypothetical protein
MASLVAQKRALIDIDELTARLSIAKGTLYNWVFTALRQVTLEEVGKGQEELFDGTL